MIFTATCKMGLEALVSHQLKSMDINVISVEDARVRFEGDYSTMARACLWLRCAERVLLELSVFEARSFDELFEGVRAIRWKDYLKSDSFIHVNGKSAKSTLFSVSDCQSISKKAIVENLKEAYHAQTLPETGNSVIIEIGILRDVVTVALDPCGAGLSRRGYRTYNVAAPISETLGAAIVMLSRYRASIPLIDPMCGSGTMPIEAAMIARNQAPGLSREFAAETWFFLNRSVFSDERQRAHDMIVDIKPEILGSDIDARCIDICKRHAKKAGITVNWAVKPLSEFSAISDVPGIIVCNPPYGERLMSRHDTDRLYSEMSRVFGAVPDWGKSIITANRDFETAFGKKADKRRKLSNGGMSCTLYQYFMTKNTLQIRSDRL